MPKDTPTYGRARDHKMKYFFSCLGSVIRGHQPVFFFFQKKEAHAGIQFGVSNPLAAEPEGSSTLILKPAMQVGSEDVD